MKEYTILSAEDIKDLSKKVSNAIMEGWQPLGGVAVNTITVAGVPLSMFFQAVVR